MDSFPDVFVGPAVCRTSLQRCRHSGRSGDEQSRKAIWSASRASISHFCRSSDDTSTTLLFQSLTEPHASPFETPDSVQSFDQMKRSPQICPVCERAGCSLRSHKSYMEQLKHDQPLLEGGERGRVVPAFMASPDSAPSPSSTVEYPIVMDVEKHHLLTLWSQNWGIVQRGPERHLFPTRLIDVILPSALKHAPLFQSLLAMSASMNSLTRRVTGDVASRHLRAAAAMLSSIEVNAPDVSSDEYILALCVLVLIYLACGNVSDIDENFSKLVQMVSQRGGLHYLGLSGVIAELLLHVDAMQAILHRQCPTFILPLPALQIGLNPTLGNAFRVSRPSAHLSSDVLQAADSLCRATDILSVPLSVNRTVSGPMNSFGYLSAVSEYQLACCNATSRQTTEWDDCVGAALLLFSRIVLHNTGAIDMLSRKLEAQFWSAFKIAITRHESKIPIPLTLVLWMLITGLTPCVYAESEHRSAAIENIRVLRVEAAVRDWSEFKEKVLDSHVWLRSAQEDTFRAVWLEVEA